MEAQFTFTMRLAQAGCAYGLRAQPLLCRSGFAANQDGRVVADTCPISLYSFCMAALLRRSRILLCVFFSVGFEFTGFPPVLDGLCNWIRNPQNQAAW